MSLPIDQILEYGALGVTVFLLYRIITNHLTSIEGKLDKIIELLSH